MFINWGQLHANAIKLETHSTHTTLLLEHTNHIKPLSCTKGKCEVDQVDKVIKLHGMANVVGRSLVIHKPNGDPLACGAIVWSETDSRNILSASTTYANYPV